MGFLTDVVERTRTDLERQPLDDAVLLSRARAQPPARDFLAALRGATAPAVIAEVKRASPSAGAIRDADPADQARAYERAGAAAISVLTERRHFDGSLLDVQAARRAVALPVLRKDFVVHPSQVLETRASGADAVLLIAAAVSELELKGLVAAAGDLGLVALVEAHGDEDLGRALATDAELIGVNARDLETLEVDVDRAIALLRRVPSDRFPVAESGLSSEKDIARAVEAGARAVLIGEALMRAEDPVRTLRELRGASGGPPEEEGGAGGSKSERAGASGRHPRE
jgi:indole-3-glycerol phosphate synthase